MAKKRTRSLSISGNNSSFYGIESLTRISIIQWNHFIFIIIISCYSHVIIIGNIASKQGYAIVVVTRPVSQGTMFRTINGHVYRRYQITIEI